MKIPNKIPKDPSMIIPKDPSNVEIYPPKRDKKTSSISNISSLDVANLINLYNMGILDPNLQSEINMIMVTYAKEKVAESMGDPEINDMLEGFSLRRRR